MGEFENDFEVTEEPETLVEEVEHFLAEDIDESLKACAMCTLQRTTKDGKNFVCGTFKARNDFAKRKDYPPIEETFWCSEFVSE